MVDKYVSLEVFEKISKGKLQKDKRIFVFYGPEDYLKVKLKEKLRDYYSLQSENKIFCDEKPKREIIEELSTLSLFQGNELFSLKNVQDFQGLLKEILKIQPTPFVVFEIKDLKDFFSDEKIIYVEFPYLKEYDPKKFLLWVDKEIKNMGILLLPQEKEILLKNLPKSMLETKNTLLKVFLFKLSNTKNSLKEFKDLVFELEENPDFLEALLNPPPNSQAFDTINSLISRKENPFMVLAVLVKGVLDLYQLKRNPNYKKFPPNYLKTLKKLAEIYTLHDLKVILLRLLNMERKAKSRSVNLWYYLEEFSGEILWGRYFYK